MTLDIVRLPTFRQSQTAMLIQTVMLMSGKGIVRSHKHEGEHWTYIVEMALDIKPNFGRTGTETMGLFREANVHAA